ncbi:30S ribosomal protein S21 [Candidatus Peregrinibacteria bacterium]|nr:30S ribosomal protein S21 [Candidatus Peregrinibacteria bacterium]
MLYAIKKPNESNERLISRFKKLVQRSRVVMDTKKTQYHANAPTKGRIRKAAIMRSHYRKLKEKNQYRSA